MIKESEIKLRLHEENTRVSAERERLRLKSQLMQAKIDAERAELEATFREQFGDGSVTSPAGSVRVRENVERYLTGLTSSVVPGQPFEDERVKPETGKYAVDSRPICKFCDGTHELEKCFKFRDKRYAQRKDFVRKQNLCENCLKPNHIARRCRSLGACLLSGCGEKHHSLLHPPSPSGTPMGSGGSGRTQTTSDQVNTNSSEANEESATARPHYIEASV